MKVQRLNIHLCLTTILLLSTLLITSHSFAQNIQATAKEIIPDAGVISSFWEGESNKAIIIFEEMHNSRVGQIEIALMLNRLCKRYHISIIALEGAFIDKGPLDNKWYLGLSDTDVREDVGLQLLREGEISAAEFIALVIPEVVVIGNEEEKEYNFELSSEDESSYYIYLFAIAEKLFPTDNDNIAHANKLAREVKKASDKNKPKKLKELMDYVINANEWTKERYDNLKNKDKITSIEEELNGIQEIRNKAEELHVDLSQYENKFNKLNDYYVMASKRTITMVNNTLALSDRTPGTPVAMIMGAGHTEKAIKILKEKGVSYVVIRPEALAKWSNAGNLSLDAFYRKQKMHSVDDEGLIGQFIDGRWKPRSVLDQTWFRSKSELYYITTLIAHAAGAGDRPPFKSLESEFSGPKYIKIDPTSFKIVGHEVTFKVTAQTNNPDFSATFWGRTVMIPYGKKSLEERLKEILREAKNRGIVEREKNHLKIVKVSRDTIAAFSKTFGVISKVKLTG